MFNRNTSLLAGAMTDDQLRDALAKAQQAYIDLATGSHGVSFSYTQETGHDQCPISKAPWLICWL
jgi:hypothetical protein